MFSNHLQHVRAITLVRVLGISLAVVPLASTWAQTTVPETSVIPIRFVQNINSKHAYLEERVLARTTQAIILQGGQRLNAGSAVYGHVVSSSAKPGEPSTLTIHFDRIQSSSTTVSLSAFPRALAGPIEVEDALIPHRLDEQDGWGYTNLVGGGFYSPFDKQVQTLSEERVAEVRRGRVIGRLAASDHWTPSKRYQCSGSQAEQTLDIFAPSACGLYGFPDEVTLTASPERGSFDLQSAASSVELPVGSRALLEQTANR